MEQAEVACCRTLIVAELVELPADEIATIAFPYDREGAILQPDHLRPEIAVKKLEKGTSLPHKVGVVVMRSSPRKGVLISAKSRIQLGAEAGLRLPWRGRRAWVTVVHRPVPCSAAVPGP